MNQFDQGKGGVVGEEGEEGGSKRKAAGFDFAFFFFSFFFWMFWQEGDDV